MISLNITPEIIPNDISLQIGVFTWKQISNTLLLRRLAATLLRNLYVTRNTDDEGISHTSPSLRLSVQGWKAHGHAIRETNTPDQAHVSTR